MNAPGRLDDVHRVVAPLTRLEAVFDDLSHPEPGVAESSRLRLTAADGAVPVATLEGIKVHAAPRVVVVQRVEVAGDQVARLIDATRPFLSAQAPAWTAFGAQAATITPPVNDLKSVQFKKMRVQRSSTSDQDEAPRWQALFVEGSEGHRGEVTVVKVRSGAFEVRLDATQASLPAWLALHNTPLASLAPHAVFQGVVQWTCSPDDCSTGVIRGVLVNLDLSDLLPAGSIHRAVGEVRVEIEELKFEGQSMTSLSGTMHSSGGAVSRSMLMAAADYLYCKLPREPLDDMQAFDRLGIRFEVDDRGVTLTSALPASPDASTQDVKLMGTLPGECLVISGREAALIAPAHPQLPVTFLAQFACGIRHHWQLLPATTGAVELFSRMPAPRRPAPIGRSATSPGSQ